MTLDPHADRTALRLKLFENGFTPLPNKRKMSLLPGWSTLKVTPEEINSKAWARSKAFLDTGVRCGDIVALDWDIDDPALLNEMLDAVIANGLVEESPFIRIGRPPRELWVFRTSDRIGKRTTGHFVPRGTEDPEFSGYAVEVLGAGCQFAAFGQRDDTTAYSWPEQSLLDHPYMDLPVITLKQVEALKDFCSAFFESHGLERKSPGGGTDGGYTHAYDLTPEMEFDVHELGRMALPELEAALQANPEETLRVTVEAFRPTSGSWAGMASLVGGSICISDHGTYTSHFPEELDTRRSMAELGLMLAKREEERGPVAPVIAAPANHSAEMLNPRDEFDENLAKAMKRYVFNMGGNTVHDLQSSIQDMTPQHFANNMAQFYHEEAGPLGARKVVRLADMWMQHPDRINVSSAQMRPDQPVPLYFEDGEQHLNTYRPIVLPETGDAEPGFEFLRQLLPIEAERRYFTQWLANKLANPNVRGPGVVMVAHDRYGTGRGTLVYLLRAIVGTNLVKEVDFSTLTGKTYQSQYNEWMLDSLFVAVNEAQEVSPGASKWQTRSNAYENLKEIIDPGKVHIDVKRKGAKNGQGRTYSSILVFTNHGDSIVMPEGDRRLAILENGVPPSEQFFIDFYAWMQVPENVGAFAAQLKRTDLTGFSAYTAPPMTASKAEMVEAGTSEIDRVFNRVMASFANTLMVRDQLVLRIEDDIADSAVELPDDWRRLIDAKFQRATRKLPDGLPDRVRIDGKQRTVRMVGRPEARALQDADGVLEEVLRNGPVVRSVKTGNVVAFPMR